MARLPYKFWLNNKSKRDVKLMRQIQKLKDRNEFMKAIRFGLWNYGTDIAGDIEASRKLDEIKKMLAEHLQNPQPIATPEPIEQTEPRPSNNGAPRKLDVPQFAAPVFDDDDDDDDLIDIRVDENAGKRANENFLASLQALLDSE